MIQNTLKMSLPQKSNGLSPFIEHIAEFRLRLIYIVIAITIGSIFSYIYRDYILSFLLKPLESKQLYYTSPLGALSFTFEICLVSGIILASPFWLYHFWMFLRPAIPDNWQQKFWLWIAISTTLALLGVLYGYFVSLPAALSISEYFQSTHLTPLLSATEYLSFVTKYILAFALFFQIPLIIFFASLMGVITSKKLIQHQRHAFIASCILGAVFTPTPDAINQLILALPLFTLYELSMLAVILSDAKHKKIKYY
jgi:sec-independent protein translocase protein TatC